MSARPIAAQHADRNGSRMPDQPYLTLNDGTAIPQICLGVMVMKPGKVPSACNRESNRRRDL